MSDQEQQPLYVAGGGKPFQASITINHPQGLHLRVGKDLVHLANQFVSAIAAQNLTRLSPIVDVKSILQLMQLQARQGHIVQISAEGPDAQDALAALCALLETVDVDPVA